MPNDPRVTKRVIGHLDRCYALEALIYQGAPHVLIASEPDDRCLLYTAGGTFVDTVWEHPGGVMGMAAIPGADGAFLTIHRFYSFNDAASSCVSLVRFAEGCWQVRELARIPFLHRIAILQRGGKTYFVACQLKSGHEYENDWRFPGKLYGCTLDALLTQGSDALTIIRDGLLYNHGCWKQRIDGYDTALIASDKGVERLIPPAAAGGSFTLKPLISDPTSDALLFDLDGDGMEELCCISPFHGDRVRIYHKADPGYQLTYEHPELLPFLHGITAGTFGGKSMLLTGNRSGEKALYAFTFDAEASTYRCTQLDAGGGPANLLPVPQADGTPALFAANREAGEIAVYRFQ